MSPRRLLRRRYVATFLAGAVSLVALAAGAWALQERSTAIDRLIFEQCVANESQDAVIVAQLRAAKQRARASLPKGSAELLYQLEILDDGIATLEPEGEEDCVR